MTMVKQKFILKVAGPQHTEYAEIITEEMASSAKARGTGIAKRSPEYIKTKMLEGKAVIALSSEGEWAGFCYIEAWGHGKYVANSGLIVSPNFRKSGLAREIKKAIYKKPPFEYLFKERLPFYNNNTSSTWISKTTSPTVIIIIAASVV